MTRLPAIVAWSVLAVTVVLLGTGVFLTEMSRASGRDLPPVPLVLAICAVLVPAALVGAVVATRHPRNPVGWLFLAYPFGFALSIASGSYRDLGLPGAEYADWTSRLADILWFGGATLGLLVFPDGHLPSRRWRWVAWIPVLAPALTVVPPDAYALAHLSKDALYAVGIFVGLAVAIAALVVRFRGAHGVVRQQLKWVFYAATLVLGALLLMPVTFQLTRDPTAVNYVFIFLLLSLGSVPLAAGVAMLRYRLYEIDVLINRTLVYGATSGGIAIAFFTGIVVLQTLLRPLTSGSELAVAASTLVSFALFQPLRRRVQEAVDRRFYRSRYDAARTLDDFSARLRDEVDLDAVSADLIDAVVRTMQPVRASLWLKAFRR